MVASVHRADLSGFVLQPYQTPATLFRMQARHSRKTDKNCLSLFLFSTIFYQELYSFRILATILLTVGYLLDKG
jgi:hypothetical protein